MRIYLVRHGQSANNANHISLHVGDPPLTDIGRKQAQITSHALLSENLDGAHLYISPMRRTLETAEPIRHLLDLRGFVRPDICEAGGMWERNGMGAEEILREWPGVELSPDIGQDGWWYSGDIEEAEDAFYDRADRITEDLVGHFEPNAPPVILVTHGRFGSALVSRMLGLNPGGFSRFPFDNCGISRLDIDLHSEVGAYPPPPGYQLEKNGKFLTIRLRSHSSTSHLSQELITD